MTTEQNSRVRGISVCNPVAIEPDYLMKTVQYALRHGVNHMQVIGPIHDPVRGNLDGMTEYGHFSRFNAGKDEAFIRKTRRALNEACRVTAAAGIQTFVWHHELDLPDGFGETYPETLNEYGDYEITHPLIRAFLVEKVRDFFAQYPLVDGIVLTLHETKVPLLKLKSQKLGRTERVKYVTEILYNACRELGKTLIVRPFASIPEDYDMMMRAYAEISPELPVMDKWTQFDWSLTLPDNAFFRKIHNPLLVEADVFGEYFGKGRLPLMLRRHIDEKIAYCETFPITGYAARIDRNGMTPFGDVNEVNTAMMAAAMGGGDTGRAADAFFEERYPGAGEAVAALMAPTEDILRKIIYLKGYYFSELSYFPTLNHAKNHFYFEMMKDSYEIVSGEWFVPAHWERGTIESVLAEKEDACRQASGLLAELEGLRARLEPAAYQALLLKFRNLQLVADVWQQLVWVFLHYTRWFETRQDGEEAALEAALGRLAALRRKGEEQLGERFYCLLGNNDARVDFIGDFVRETRESFAAEKREVLATEAAGGYLDYIVCGGGAEGHRLMKEVNFSDTLLRDGRLCRIPGNRQGMAWSQINAHGWFSYEVRVRPMAESVLELELGSSTALLSVKVTVGETETVLREPLPAGTRTLSLPYRETAGHGSVRVRVDRLTGDTPCVFRILSR